MGAGFSIDKKPQVRYFAGISLLAGKDNRLAITCGTAFGKEKALSSVYDANSSQAFGLPTGSSEIHYKEGNFNTHFFMSATYNIPFFKNNQTVPTSEEEPAAEDDSKKADSGDKDNKGEGE
jgi:hypothetical protein